MLATLRRINWPEGLQPVGNIIKSDLIGQVASYDDLIREAEKQSTEIIQEGEKWVASEVLRKREEVIKEVRKDYEVIKNLFDVHRRRVEESSAELCVEISKIAIKKIINELDTKNKLKFMVNSLVRNFKAKGRIKFGANPEQVEDLKEVIGTDFKRIFGNSEIHVVSDDSLDYDQVRVYSVSDSYMDVSLNNLVKMLCREVENLTPQLKPSSFTADSANHASTHAHNAQSIEYFEGEAK